MLTDDPECVDAVLRHGGDPNVLARRPLWWGVAGYRALHLAVFWDDIQDRPAVIRQLVGSGAAVDSTTKEIAFQGRTLGQQGWTPLTVASFKGHLKLVEVLLGLGADPAFPGPDGRPGLPLREAEERLRRIHASIAKQEAEIERSFADTAEIANVPLEDQDSAR
jgi:hypothetical protein